MSFNMSEQYDFLKLAGIREAHPAGNVLLRYWEHCEVLHDATREDFGNNVKEWHNQTYPECTLPSYDEAKKVDFKDTKVIATRIMKDPHSTVADRQVARIFLGLPDDHDNQH